MYIGMYIVCGYEYVYTLVSISHYNNWVKYTGKTKRKRNVRVTIYVCIVDYCSRTLISQKRMIIKILQDS